MLGSISLTVTAMSYVFWVIINNNPIGWLLLLIPVQTNLVLGGKICELKSIKKQRVPEKRVRCKPPNISTYLVKW
jgi:hypothetical protein